jgi:hypothetical protein
VICDNALLTGFALGRQPVDSEVILEVAYDLDLGGRRIPDTNLPAVTEAQIVSEPAERPEERRPPADAGAVGTSASAPHAEDPRTMFRESTRSPRFSLFGRR